MLTANDAARRLGVKPETLYAYVSRGMLTRHRAEDGRRSLFERAEIERLAARSRRGGRAAGLEVIVDTSITRIDPEGALYYRGRDATVLARERSFEEVAELLWDAEAALGSAAAARDEAEARGAAAARGDAAAGSDAAAPWIVSGGAAVAAPGATVAPSARLVDRVRVIVALAAAADPLRKDLRPPAVRHTARSLIAAMVDGLPRLS